MGRALENAIYRPSWREIAKFDVTNLATVDIAFPATASLMRLNGIWRTPNTTLALLAWRGSVDGGLSYLAGASDYFSTGHYSIGTTAHTSYDTVANAYAPIQGVQNNFADIENFFDLTIFPGDGVRNSSWTSLAAGYQNKSTQSHVSGYRGTTSPAVRMTHVRFLMSTGANIGRLVASVEAFT